VKRTCYEANHYGVSSRFKYSLEHFVLRHPNVRYSFVKEFQASDDKFISYLMFSKQSAATFRLC
jgi:hypothetical protein